jgi:isocitrate dehydrogenase
MSWSHRAAERAIHQLSVKQRRRAQRHLALGSQRVTYDFARLMDGATEIKCSEFGEFGENIIAHL